MAKRRTPAEVGKLIKQRRIRRRIKQDGIPGVSSSTVRKMESGAADSFSLQTLLAVADALNWPEDFYERLSRGRDISEIDELRADTNEVLISAAMHAGRLTSQVESLQADHAAEIAALAARVEALERQIHSLQTEALGAAGRSAGDAATDVDG